jgi:ubiquinone/menaquinone biosynthesis C-methylase UbiE
MGAVLFPLAEKVGPSGKVVGIDISKQVLAETSLAVQKRDIRLD